MLNIFDISENNVVRDLKLTASAGYVEGIAKATEGATFHDKTFPTHYAAIHAAGMIRGAYNLARPATSSAFDEANAYVQFVVANGGFESPPILDMEDAGGLTATQLQAYCRIWGARVISLTKYPRPILYCNVDYIKTYGLDALADMFDLWLAYYGTGAPNVGKFPCWLFEQHTEKGTVPGIDGAVDLNYFMGTLDDLKRLCMEVDNVQKTTVKVNGVDIPAVIVDGQTYPLWTGLEQVPGTFSKVNVGGEWQFTVTAPTTGAPNANVPLAIAKLQDAIKLLQS